ncbi:hypothetical protein TNIN_133641 [Trichonephila inaurata madagascariensis]|uniref:Uncharacterized protein n=1 Tax=Trichonephila inaurata madagascariensis TaxID=2747483 RepID=A0A8X6I9E6_9ARAC|nr:hypothetical protein TNIN_133641 [Trichonephila inaurata madagascariensis]
MGGLGMDSNTQNYGLVPPDARGDKLSEFISVNNFLLSMSLWSYFCVTRGTSHIDITVVGSDLSGTVGVFLECPFLTRDDRI